MREKCQRVEFAAVEQIAATAGNDPARQRVALARVNELRRLLAAEQ